MWFLKIGLVRRISLQHFCYKNGIDRPISIYYRERATVRERNKEKEREESAAKKKRKKKKKKKGKIFN